MNLRKLPERALLALASSALIALVTSCAGVVDSMTPSTQAFVDEFDGRRIVRQPPVSAASGLGESFHTLGFEWMEKYPNSIFITAGVAMRTSAIADVAFNADGRIFDKLKLASSLTDFEYQASSRRFELPLEDFVVIATASLVKMRLGGINAYTVSSFGHGAGSSAVNAKFGPFLDAVRIARAKSKL